MQRMTGFYLQGQSNEIFHLQFFPSFEPAWAIDQWAKKNSILVKFRQVIQIFMNLPWVWYCAELISPGYHTLVSQMTFLDPI